MFPQLAIPSTTFNRVLMGQVSKGEFWDVYVEGHDAKKQDIQEERSYEMEGLFE